MFPLDPRWTIRYGALMIGEAQRGDPASGGPSEPGAGFKVAGNRPHPGVETPIGVAVPVLFFVFAAWAMPIAETLQFNTDEGIELAKVTLHS